jgi:peptidoglycan/LPS O-acetylase OafA/YrhL
LLLGSSGAGVVEDAITFLRLKHLSHNFWPLYPDSANDNIQDSGGVRREGRRMTRLDRSYIIIGLAWVIAAMIFGTWLGASNHINYANSHAHVGVLGFVTSILFGLLHWAYPELGKSRIAVWQFAIYEVGVALLIIGKVLVDGGTETLFLQVGSLVTILGTAMMLWMFARQGTLKSA